MGIKKIMALLVGLLVGLNSWAQYADTLTVTLEDSVEAYKPQNYNMFANVQPLVDPLILYAQAFWASNKFDPELLKHHNPFQLKDNDGKVRKFDSTDVAISRYMLAICDYDKKKEPYTKYLEQKPGTGWAPTMSAKLLEIYEALYGFEYDHTEKKKRKFKPEVRPLRFMKADSLSDKRRAYYGKFVATERDKNYADAAAHNWGPLEAFTHRPDTQLVYIVYAQMVWATEHLDAKMLKYNNVFQVVDNEGEPMRYETLTDAVAHYYMLTIDYDGQTESYCDYLVRRTNGGWTKEMSAKLKTIYRQLWHWYYDERKFSGYVDKDAQMRRTKSSRSRNIL